MRPCAWNTQIYSEEDDGHSELRAVAMGTSSDGAGGKQFCEVSINRSPTIEARGAVGVERN